ncbi:hypothetical protein HMPREF1002_04480 [Porphyromonas sp. 31_2]|nr:hypothetical protein HMPREF1002_04480 [Porphyromonas sp. 31_2]
MPSYLKDYVTEYNFCFMKFIIWQKVQLKVIKQR